MYFLSIRIFTAVFTCALGIFSAAPINNYFYPASQDVRIGEAVIANIRTLSSVSHYSVPFLNGRGLALEDLKRGHLRVASNAKETEKERIFRDILLKEYGIETLFFGWTNNQELLKQSDQLIDGYNRTAGIAIVQRFGWDVVENVRARAIAEANREQEEINWKIILKQQRILRSIG